MKIDEFSQILREAHKIHTHIQKEISSMLLNVFKESAMYMTGVEIYDVNLFDEAELLIDFKCPVKGRCRYIILQNGTISEVGMPVKGRVFRLVDNVVLNELVCSSNYNSTTSNIGQWPRADRYRFFFNILSSAYYGSAEFLNSTTKLLEDELKPAEITLEGVGTECISVIIKYYGDTAALRYTPELQCLGFDTSKTAPIVMQRHSPGTIDKRIQQKLKYEL